jgi:hypothetical protein
MNRIKDLATLAIALAAVVALSSPAKAIPTWEQIQCFKPFTQVIKTTSGTYVVTYACDGKVLSWTKKIQAPARK